MVQTRNQISYDRCKETVSEIERAVTNEFNVQEVAIVHMVN